MGRRLPSEPEKQRNSPATIAFAMLVAGVQTAGIWLDEIFTGLGQVYCTPAYCLPLPLALTGWALAVALMPLYVWRRDVARYVAVFLASFLGVLFFAADKDVFGLWMLPLSFFVVGLVFVPASILFSTLARPGWRAVAVAGQHWLVLAGLILWLA